MARSLVRPRSLSIAAAFAVGAFAAFAAGCGSAAPPAPTPVPSAAPKEASNVPTPKSVTEKNPGGDAADPEKAALERLASEPWGFRRDRWNSLHVNLIDWKNWKRVRIWGHPTRATYRYGDDHRAITTVLYTAIDGPNDPDTCLAKFMDYANTTAQAYGVRLGDSQLVRMNQIVNDVAKPMVVKLLEGSVNSILANDDYVGAIAAYQSFPGTCLVQGFTVVSTNHRDLAIKIRDRWVAEGASGLVWEKNVKAAPTIEAR